MGRGTEENEAFYRRNLDLWNRCGLAGWYVLIANASVVDFYGTAAHAMQCAPRASAHRTTLKRIPGQRAPRSPFTRPCAGEISPENA